MDHDYTDKTEEDEVLDILERQLEEREGSESTLTASQMDWDENWDENWDEECEDKEKIGEALEIDESRQGGELGQGGDEDGEACDDEQKDDEGGQENRHGKKVYKAIDLFQPYFYHVEYAIELLIARGLLFREGECFKCGRNNMKLTSLPSKALSKRFDDDVGLFYICKRHGCQMKRSIYYGTALNRSRASLPRVLQSIFLFLANSTYMFKQECLNMSIDAINNNKKIILGVIDQLFQEKNPMPIGGPGKSVQIDETIVVKGQKVKCPTKIKDEEFEDGIWIVGGVEENNPKRFFVTGVANRKAATMAAVITKHVAPGTEILTDGDKSYPAALISLPDLVFSHIAVNHSQGFIGKNGRHTNKIEALWSGMQGLINRRRGLKSSEVDDFLVEYRWRKLFQDNFSEQFLLIVDKLFERLDE